MWNSCILVVPLLQALSPASASANLGEQGSNSCGCIYSPRYMDIVCVAHVNVRYTPSRIGVDRWADPSSVVSYHGTEDDGGVGD
jgi:hypothetical protein